MKTKKQKQSAAVPILFLSVLLTLTACKKEEQPKDEATLMMRAENAQDIEKEQPILALVLTSRDAPENEGLIESFQEMAEEQEAELLIRFPDVSEKEALEAQTLKGSFILCEVDPIEYQMLIINELVAENTDVIAIHPNHKEALDPILTAARATGIRICAFGHEIGEESRDIYTTTEQAPTGTAELIKQTD